MFIHQSESIRSSIRSIILGISVLMYLIRSGVLCSSAVMDFFVNSGSVNVKSAMASNESRISFLAIVRSLILWNHSSEELMDLSEVSKFFFINYLVMV